MTRRLHLFLAPIADPAQSGWEAITLGARAAERGVFDGIFAPRPSVHHPYEPTTLLPALGALTTTLGVVLSVSAEYVAPYNQARYISTLDHLTTGRAGWHLVGADRESAPELHGLIERATATRSERRGEYAQVLEKLWTSWQPDAVIADREAGIYVHADRIHPVDHNGEHFSVAGPFNLPRSPQVAPPLFVDVLDEEDARFALGRADVAVIRVGATVSAAALLHTENLGDRAAAPLVLSEIEWSARAGRSASTLLSQFGTGQVDGFVVRATSSDIAIFVDSVVPALQTAQVYPDHYEHPTLRGLLGLGEAEAVTFSSESGSWS